MSENEMEQPEVEEIDAPEVEQDEPEQPDPDLEAEARKYGWRASEEYDKPPEGWMDAERFLEHPKTRVKMFRDEAKRREQESRDLREQITRIGSATKAQMEAIQRQERERYEAKLNEYRQAKMQAVQEADLDRYQEIEREERTMRPPSQPQQDPDARMRESVGKLSDGRAWIDDPELRSWGANYIQHNLLGLSQAEQVRRAEAKAREIFADRFHVEEKPPPKPQPRQRVQGAAIASSERSKGVNSLPAEARKKGEEFIEMGLFKDLDAYAKSYWSEQNA